MYDLRPFALPVSYNSRSNIQTLLEGPAASLTSLIQPVGLWLILAPPKWRNNGPSSASSPALSKRSWRLLLSLRQMCFFSSVYRFNMKNVEVHLVTFSINGHNDFTPCSCVNVIQEECFSSMFVFCRWQVEDGFKTFCQPDWIGMISLQPNIYVAAKSCKCHISAVIVLY